MSDCVPVAADNDNRPIQSRRCGVNESVVVPPIGVAATVSAFFACPRAYLYTQQSYGIFSEKSTILRHDRHGLCVSKTLAICDILA